MSLSLRKAARAASQLLEEFLTPVGLHASQYGILSHLSRRGPTSMTHLSDDMSVDRTTMTRNVQIMVRDGMLKIESGDDRRVRRIELTPHGEILYSKARPLWEQAQVAIAERLGGNESAALIDLADQLTSLTEK